MKALILVGGLGTRLRSVVDGVPKPMMRVGGRPFLEYLIIQLKQQGMGDIILSTGHLGGQVRRYFGDGRPWHVRVAYSHEKVPLGTAGAIRFARNLVSGDDFLAMNGDSFLATDLRTLVKYHTARGALATIALTEVKEAARYGTVELDDTGKISSFVEKGVNSKSRLINGGVYVFSKQLFSYIGEGKVSLEHEVFPELIGRGFYGMPVEGFFVDIGLPETYTELKAKPEKMLRFIDSGGG